MADGAGGRQRADPTPPTPTRHLTQHGAYDLFELLLPSDHGSRTPRGTGAVWEKHFQNQQQPVRPQTGRRPRDGCDNSSVGFASHPTMSPRLGAPPQQQQQQHCASLSPLSTSRCKSASVARASVSHLSHRFGQPATGGQLCERPPTAAALRRLADTAVSPRAVAATDASRSPRATQPYELETRRAELNSSTSSGAGDASPAKSAAASAPVPDERAAATLEINPRAREHIEVTACMLAYMHRVNVHELQRVREQAQHAIERVRVQKFAAQSGLVHDGSDFETAKRKTAFLLRHFFAFDDGSQCTPQQDRLLYDVIEDWQCSEDASSDDIASVWASVTHHIEQSYILRRKLVLRGDPDRISVRIALDCLRKLALQLPAYQRVLDVVLCILESGLFVRQSSRHSSPQHISASANSSGGSSGHGQPQSQPQGQSSHQQRLYFEECDELERKLETARTLTARSAEQQRLNARLSVREQICALLLQLRDDEPMEKEALFLTFLRGNLEVIASLACGEVLKYVFEHANSEKRSLFYALWLRHLSADEALRALQELASAHLDAFRCFLLENLDAMDAILIDTSSASSSLATNKIAGAAITPGGVAGVRAPAGHALFHRLIERHPSEFAAILWQSPFLTAQVFQGSQFLVARIIEQNIFLVSQVLLQRHDVLLSLLTHTLKDSTTVLEEFFLSHPRGLTDLLVNRPAMLADAVKANDAILYELLLSCRPTFAKMLLATPGTMSHILRTHPELLAQILRDDPTLLAVAFTLVPQLLSETLEKHPEFFLDIAHRRPVLVTRLFAKHPDLLMEPLEANPTLFSNFLVYHRDVLPDLAAPGFNPMLFQIESKKFESVATQTSRNLAKFGAPLRIREQIERHETEMLAIVRAAKQASASDVGPSARLARMSSSMATVSADASLQRKDSSVVTALPSTQRKGSAFSQSVATSLQRKDSSMAATAAVASLQRKDSSVASTNPQHKNSTTLHDTGAGSHSVDCAAVLEPDSVTTLTPGEVAHEIARIYVRKIHADALDDAARRSRQDLVPFIKDAYLQDLGFKALAHKKLAQLVVSATCAGHTQEKMRIKWFLRFANVTPRTRLHRAALDFYLLALQRLLPLDHLPVRLEHEPYHTCLVTYADMKEFVDDPLVSRLLANKDQRQQLLMLQVLERDALLGATAAAAAGALSGSTGPQMPHASARHRDSALSSQLQQSPSVAMLHVDDVLDSTMNVWLQYQARVREEWSALFQRINPDGSGVVHYSAFAALVRTKLTFVDDRRLLKTFHLCGEENELGEFALLLEDFTLAMFVLQEQDELRQLALRS